MAEQPQPRYKRSFRNVLLNKRLQLNYALWVTCVSAAIATLLGFLIYDQSTFASDQILAGLGGPGMEWVDADTKRQIQTELGRSDLSLVTTMMGLGVALALGLLGSLIVMTHRVAGPLFRMARYFDELGAGQLPTVGALRKGDQFQELFVTLSEAIEALRARRTAEDVVVSELEAVWARTPQGVPDGVRQTLASLRSASPPDRR